eukprot:scaffold281829_cov24-Prasinocladus_malaysianus.AAC.1
MSVLLAPSQPAILTKRHHLSGGFISHWHSLMFDLARVAIGYRELEVCYGRFISYAFFRLKVE